MWNLPRCSYSDYEIYKKTHFPHCSNYVSAAGSGMVKCCSVLAAAPMSIIIRSLVRTFWTVRHRLFLSPEHKPSDSKETGAAAAVSPKSRLEASVSHQLALTAHAGLP